jgi:hypothetical protein
VAQIPPKGKPYTQFPMDHSLGDQSKQALDWIVTTVNQLVGLANAPTTQGVNSLSVQTVDPTLNTITSLGSRMNSVATPITFDAGGGGSTSITFYWDGTHSSQAFTIYRDDGSSYGPIIRGSPLTVTGLVAATTYYFYPYFDENLQQIEFASTTGATGTPAIAYLAQSALASQQQILRNRIPLALLLASTGALLGSGSGSGGSGGGGGGGGGGGRLK